MAPNTKPRMEPVKFVSFKDFNHVPFSNFDKFSNSNRALVFGNDALPFTLSAIMTLCCSLADPIQSDLRKPMQIFLRPRGSKVQAFFLKSNRTDTMIKIKRDFQN